MAGEAADESLNRLISGVDGLGIADGSDGPPLPQTLIAAIYEFEQIVECLNEQASNIKTLLSSNGELANGNTATVSQVYRQTNRIGRVALWLNDAVLRSIVTHITSLDNRGYSDTPKLLKHFGDSIKTITRRFISQGNSDYAHTLWRIVEECCIQAVPSGKLDPEDYFSEDMEARTQLNDRSKKEAEEDWTRFWAQCLNKCPGGPTLFIPPKHRLRFQLPPPPADDTPRYLFRAYDSGSWGSNGEEVFTSRGHERYGPVHSKLDLITMDKQSASTMLHRHLNGPRRSTNADNLVSWSSSLLSTIQYANYRCWNYAGQDPSNVFICTLDTTKFPTGQFASAKWLRGRYTRTRLDKEESEFLEKRFRNPDYGKGEYLSQGTLNVQGRSCTTSLLTLQEAGLGSLYQQLDINTEPDEFVRKKWPVYVRRLRDEWKTPHETTEREIEVARNMARECFGVFNEMDIVLLLLAFRSRMLRGGVRYRNGKPRVMYKEEPDEVQRYGHLKLRQRTRSLDPATCLAQMFVLKLDDGSI